MPEPSSTGRPRRRACSRAARPIPAQGGGSGQVPLRLVQGSRHPHEHEPTDPGAEVILITEGGLELPLVASTMQVARLRDGVRRVAFDDGGNGHPVATPACGRRGSPPPVPTERILSRVRIVIRPTTCNSGKPS
jgi:hypothetical protein